MPDDKVADFAAFADLPPAFTLAKLRFLESDPEPQYWLSLNIYEVSGITTGIRAEWSTYVDDGSGVPRFMILAARAADGSMDPIGPEAPAEPFEHARGAGGVVRTHMMRTRPADPDAQAGPGAPRVLTDELLFDCEFAVPDEDQRSFVQATHEWTACNDFIYWSNGVCDRVFYNANVHSASMISIPVGGVSLDDRSDYMAFVDPEPAHVLMYLNHLEFAIGPWWNVTETDGRVQKATVDSLAELKQSLYGSLAAMVAESVASGETRPVIRSTVEGSPPALSLHWSVARDDVGGIIAALGLSGSLRPAAVRLAESDDAGQYWLSLEVHRVQDHSAAGESGLRAEWTTHVHDGQRAATLVLEALADHPVLMAEGLDADPVALEHEVVGGQLRTRIPGPGGAEPLVIDTGLPAPDSAVVMASREWVASAEQRHDRTGAARWLSHDNAVFAHIELDPGSVELDGAVPVAGISQRPPDRAWIAASVRDRVTNPFAAD
ncbi:MAG: hypothetical protein GY812_14855 [Actinomycetia bacterium]|nr:hypothetical protein [Actinomycetes bacterium]